MLKENLDKIFQSIKNGNNLGEEIKLVGATKTVPSDIIQQAISLGLKFVAENKVQEFNQKHGTFCGAEEHFIGHLQTNKVKYVVGKVSLIQSVHSVELANEINKRANSLKIVQDILLEVNIGNQESKSGFNPNDIENAFLEVKKLSNIRVVGFMTMLPISSDKNYLEKLCLQMRKIYDNIKLQDQNIQILSMGMSSDYQIAINCGSNMIRIGSAIFGKRI